MFLTYAASLEHLAIATYVIEITYKSPEQPTLVAYGIALLLNRRRWKSATGWSIKSPKTNSDRTVVPKATGIPTAHGNTAFTLRTFMRKSIYRGPSIVISTVPGGVYRAKINRVEYDNEKNRISITFTTTRNGHITRSFEALTQTNSKLREFVQGLIAPQPLPEVVTQEELRGKLLEVVGNEYLIAYTMLPGSQRLGALSAVPFQKRAA